jgi:hypothetical protein
VRKTPKTCTFWANLINNFLAAAPPPREHGAAMDLRVRTTGDVGAPPWGIT